MLYRVDDDHAQPAMRLRLLVPLAAASMLVCLPARAQFSTTLPDWISDKGTRSALSDPPISPVPNWYEVRLGSWQVPLETIEHMVSLIDARLASNKRFGNKARIAKYAIQFRGETREDRRIVRLAGACNIYDTPAWQLSAQFFNVNDGGQCYFDAVYDPVEKRLSHFEYHGHA